MPTDTYGQTRRTFLKSGVTLGGALLSGGVQDWLGSQETFAAVLPQSRLVISRDSNLRSTPTGLDSSRLVNCLDRAMQALEDCDSPLEAWRKVVRPGEVVGLKVNCLAGRGNSTRPELANAICERLQQAGIKEIVIWDRLNSDLESARFKIVERGSGIRCFGNDVLGFEEELATFGSAGSLVAKTLTQVCDAVINLPVLKDHGIAGVTIALKSMFGAIHNPNKYHMNVGNPYVADVYMLPPIRQKVRLHICDATTAQYEGGPSFMPHWTWPYNGLLVSHDPVALDYTGWQIIEKKRAEVGMKSLQEMKREPAYISTAADAQHSLGTNDPKFIKVVEA
ncbi:MAG: DUF362 domain-containing protein [Terriglobia bacterium]|jgi:uncharacterized protein (DUF362 family)